MDELIRKQDAIDALDGSLIVDGKENAERVMEYLKGINNRIKALPPVQPKHGEWEYHSNPTIGINPEDAYCSCCGFHVDTTGDIDFDEYNFCPHCGADMRGNEDDEVGS